MLNKTYGYINSNLLFVLFALGLSLTTALRVRSYIIGALGSLMLLILLGNLVKIFLVLALPDSVFAVALL